MRYLVFDLETNVDQYEILYHGIGQSSAPITAPEARVMSKIYDKFEALGEPVEREGNAGFALSKSGTVALEDVEYKLVGRVLESVPWVVKAARRITKAMELFDNAPTTEPEKVSG